jgi:hypothetical protein
VDHAKEVDVNVQQATAKHFRVVEELHQAQTSKEGYQKLSENLEI